MEKSKLLGTQPIGRLLAKYSIPAVIAMLVNAVYNVIDRFFIGKYAGESAFGGLTISFPMMMLVVSIASLIAAGGSALMSISLGKQDKKDASKVFGNSITLSLIATAFMLVIFLPFMNSILTALGATNTLLPYASAYMKIIMIGVLFQIVSMILSSTVRLEGYPMLSMMALLIPAGINIVLDYVFIGIFRMGVQGAAAATVIGQVVGFIILLSFYLKGKNTFQPTLKDLKLNLKTVRSIIAIGATSFFASIGTCISMVFLNRALNQFGGDMAITAMGAISSLGTLFVMPMLGIQQGLQPLVGYNYGAHQTKRVSKTLKLSILSSMIFGAVVFVLLQLFPQKLLQFFIDPGSETMPIAIEGLRYYVLILPVLGINFMGSAFFQSIAKGGQAIFLGTMRNILMLIPIVLILPNILGLQGVWVATPIADGITVLTTLGFLFYEIKKMKKKDALNIDFIEEAQQSA